MRTAAGHGWDALAYRYQSHFFPWKKIKIMTDPVSDAERLRPKELRFAPIVVIIAMMMHGCPLTPQHQDNLSKPSCYDCTRFLPKPFVPYDAQCVTIRTGNACSLKCTPCQQISYMTLRVRESSAHSISQCSRTGDAKSSDAVAGQ